MINRTINSNGKSGGDTELSKHPSKPNAIAMKKVALRDVQNDSKKVMPSHSAGSSSPVMDVRKVLGTKRHSVESSSDPLKHQSLRVDGANELLKHGTKKPNGELGSRKSQGHNASYAPAFAPTPTASLMTFSPGRPSLPISLEKLSNGISAADSTFPRLFSSYGDPPLVGSKGADDQKMKERLLQLQKLLKQCDDSDPREYIQMLRCLSPPELNRQAVELEKRSIHLSIEEGKEIQRMKALNILGNIQ